MNLLDVKDYVRKTANIISAVADVQIIICNNNYEIIEDSVLDVPVNEGFNKLTEDSILAASMKERRMIVSGDCRSELIGCLNCPKREECDISAIISIPIIDNATVYGAIGVYVQDGNHVDRIISQHKDFFEFLHRIADLLILKLHEESRYNELSNKVAKLENNTSTISFDDIVGSSEQITALKNNAKRFARSTSTILITGESGTGKEVFARAIHNESLRGGGPFIAINCAAIPENLVESELFGYEEGAFSGARKHGKIGKFELANNGTLFLDEVGEFPLYLQAKLLRAIQERKIQRIGGNKDININIRIICATNKSLEDAVKNGEFREDLFYRLNVIPLHLPSLRERREDIINLANYFLEIYARELKKDIFGISDEAKSKLLNYSWPGNIRELQNTIEYAVNFTDKSYIGSNDFPNFNTEIEKRAFIDLTIRPLRQVEDDYIKRAISIYGNSLEGKEQAAKALGISRATLYRKLKEIE